ncbi:hypothetical protein R1sor_010155 [Riccia sorocarpa]|uniref:AAA+ ATPase domain-containing protein n=1 Tax=Riccia sorocarpa TaxID=122646 RepID=A0ABD3I399_9MARC
MHAYAQVSGSRYLLPGGQVVSDSLGAREQVVCDHGKAHLTIKNEPYSRFQTLSACFVLSPSSARVNYHAARRGTRNREDAICRASKGTNGVESGRASGKKDTERARNEMEDGAVIVRDDLDRLLQVLPEDLRDTLLQHPRRAELLEVVLDLGRLPEARFLGDGAGEFLRDEEITREDLLDAQAAIGEFGGDNRAGIEGTLHRISGIRSRKGQIVGLTCRVGRAVTGHVDMVRDVLHHGQSILFLGRPGVGKTTVIREIARVLADDLHKRVVIIDTSNEIGGDGDVPHPAIGGARRMQVPGPSMQHKVMVEAVENHMPEVVIVDEIGTEAEALACRTIAERGVMLVGTAHGRMLENIIKNPTLCDLVGGVQTVTLGDEEARARGTQKSVLERKAPSTFPVLIEMRERSYWVAHQTDRSVDALLHGRRPTVEIRTRDDSFKVVVERKLYDGSGSSRLDSGSDYNHLMAMMGSTQSPLEDPAETYNWASKLGFVPDKDAMADRSVTFSYVGKRGPWEDYDEEFGYGSSGSSGKRGSKRGPRGVRPR